MSMPPSIRGARAAFVFLTRLPAGGYPYRDEDYAWAPAHAPLVGLVVGAMGGAVYWLLMGAGFLPAALAGIALTMLATGAFHEDGLADTSDAMGGAIFDRERMLEILKDSRIGTYGTVALVISIGLRATLIAEWGRLGAAAFVLSHVLGRVAPTWLMATMPYVTDPVHARSRPIVTTRLTQALVATFYGVLAILAAWQWLPSFGWGPGLSFVTIPVAAALCAWRFHKRAGGVTGDFLGATEQITEMTVLLTLALARP